VLISGGRHGVDGLSVLRGDVGVDLRGDMVLMISVSSGGCWC
jgi:hypothetical protein